MKIMMVAACALIDVDGRILISQRPAGKPLAGYWEFPGGKLEDGERPEEAVIRELKEELGIDIQEDCLAPFVFASHTYEDFHLVMPLFLCRKWDGQVQPMEGQKLEWVRCHKLTQFEMPPADLPLIAHLRDLLGS